MNINLTLFGQTIAFAVFVWFCMKYIWPPLVQALEERKTRIADGLAAAERARAESAAAEQRVEEELAKAKDQAKEIIAQANRRADEIVEESKSTARVEAQKIVTAAHSEIEQERNAARESLRAEVVSIAVAGAEQVLMREVDANAHNEVLEKLAAQL